MNNTDKKHTTEEMVKDLLKKESPHFAIGYLQSIIESSIRDDRSCQSLVDLYFSKNEVA